MSFFENNGAATPIKDEKNSVSEFLLSMITPDQLSSSCATPDEDESTSGASTTNDDGDGTPLSLPADDSTNFVSSKSGPNSVLSTTTSPSKSRRSAAAAAAAQHTLLPNGKKTKGRVKIKMEFIDNKLRRYTTFSKRKTGIMKKAYELSTLTGTQVMLLVASETGHVYTFATKKLQPMITSEAGKALIQTCLNSPDSPDGPPHFGESTALSANFHTSEIASLTPASLLFASGVTGNNSSGPNVNQSQQQRQTNNNSNKRSHKSNQLQQQHCVSAIQDVLAAALQSKGGSTTPKMDNGDLSILNDLGAASGKGAAKSSYYNANDLPTMVPPNSSNRFSMDVSSPNYFTQPTEPALGDEEDIDLENGDLSALSTNMASAKAHQENEHEFKSGGDAVKMVNGNSKRRSMFQKHISSPSSSTSSVSGPMSANVTAPAGSTLNNILHNIVANRQQQRQQAASSAQSQNQGICAQQAQHQNRRKRQHVANAPQHPMAKQVNIFGQSTSASTTQQAPNSNPLNQQLGSHLFPFAGLLPNAAASAQGNGQQSGFNLFPGFGNGGLMFPNGTVYTSAPVLFPDNNAAAAAITLQQMLSSFIAATNNGGGDGGGKNAQQQSQSGAGRNTSSSPAVQASQPLLPLSLPLSMMTANYLAAQQSRLQGDDFDDGGPSQMDEDESD